MGTQHCQRFFLCGGYIPKAVKDSFSVMDTQGVKDSFSVMDTQHYQRFFLCGGYIPKAVKELSVASTLAIPSVPSDSICVGAQRYLRLLFAHGGS